MKVRITKVPDKSLNARHWKHADGGLLHSYEIGGPQKRFVREVEEPRPAVRDNTMMVENYWPLFWNL